jgi:2Fe-2S ferredoxin
MVSLIFRLSDGKDVMVDAPLGSTIMEAAKANGVPGIEADCGGSMICGTCHVQVAPESQQRLPDQSDEELALLEYVPEPKPDSRLTCQMPVSETLAGMVFHVPELQR